MSLIDWLKAGWLKEHETSPEEIGDLLHIADRDLVQQFDRFRKKRNIGGYERVGIVSDQEAEEMKLLAHELRNEVGDWIKKNHPECI